MYNEITIKKELVMIINQASNILVSFLNTNPLAVMDSVLIQPYREEFCHGDDTYTMSDLISLSVVKQIRNHISERKTVISKIKVTDEDIQPHIDNIENFYLSFDSLPFKARALPDDPESTFSYEHKKVAVFYKESRLLLEKLMARIMASEDSQKKYQAIIDNNKSLSAMMGYFSTLTHCSLGTSDFRFMDEKLNKDCDEAELKKGANALSKLLTQEYSYVKAELGLR